MCLDLYVHWVSRSMHLTELKQSDWVISAWVINEFENSISCPGKHSRKPKNQYYSLLFKHQWNSLWAFPRKLHIFTRKDNSMLSSHVKRYVRYGYITEARLWKQADLVFHWCLCNKQNITYSDTRLWIWILFSRVQLDISRVAALTREVSSWPLDDKIHIHPRACNILHIFHQYQS